MLLVFGEVDIRAHIIEQARIQNSFVRDITEEVVLSYYRAIITLKELGFNVAVFGCIAGFKLVEGGQLPSWPYFGTCIERNRITKRFNGILEGWCVSDHIPFVSVFEEMLLSDGNTKTKYLDTDRAGCHVTTRMLPLILWKFRDAGLIPWEDAIIPFEGGWV